MAEIRIRKELADGIPEVSAGSAFGTRGRALIWKSADETRCEAEDARSAMSADDGTECTTDSSFPGNEYIYYLSPNAPYRRRLHCHVSDLLIDLDEKVDAFREHGSWILGSVVRAI